MTRLLETHPGAALEAQGAARYYAERYPRAALAFTEELDVAIERIEREPHIHPPHVYGTRRVLLRTFPFSISANGRKALAVARYLSADVDVRSVDVYRGEGQVEWYLRVNPQGKYPRSSMGSSYCGSRMRFSSFGRMSRIIGHVRDAQDWSAPQ